MSLSRALLLAPRPASRIPSGVVHGTTIKDLSMSELLKAHAQPLGPKTITATGPTAAFLTSLRSPGAVEASLRRLQRTIKTPFIFASDREQVGAAVFPAPSNTGIVFARTSKKEWKKNEEVVDDGVIALIEATVPLNPTKISLEKYIYI